MADAGSLEYRPSASPHALGAHREHAFAFRMLQPAENPICAIAGEWFTAQGVGQSLGPFSAHENADLSRTLRAAFTEWIDNGHNDLASPQCVILKIALTRAVLFSHGTRYDLDFA